MLRTTQASKDSLSRTERAVFQKTILDNGIRVVTETIPYVRSVSLGIWADVGSRDETAAQNGLTHFLEHMVFKGTKRRSVTDIARSLEALGGYLNAFTTKEHTCFYARVLDQHVSQAMDVLADLVLHATFKPRELEKERLVVIEELKSAEDNPEDIIHDYFEKALFPRHSLGFPIIGTEENLRHFSREDLQSHLSHYYRPDAIVVAAAGNVDHRNLVRLTGKMVRRAGLAASRGRRQAGPGRVARKTSVEYSRPINQAHVCLGNMAFGIRHRHRFPMLVLNAMLGEGMSSRLYQTIREKYGLAYSVYSYINMMSDTGVFAAYIGTDKKNVAASLDLVKKEIDTLKTRHVSKAELERTKSQIKGTMMLSLENMSSRMTRLGGMELYFQSYSSLDEVIKKIDAVTPDSVMHVARDLFREDAFTAVVIQPT